MNDSIYIDRRRFFQQSARGAIAAGVGPFVSSTPTAQGRSTEPDQPRLFRLWVMGCPHVGTDLRVGGRESLAEAIRQSEQGGDEGGPPFDWDIAVILGDFSGAQGPPDDNEGREVVRQLSATTKHRREQFYTLAGNHDGSGPDQPTMGWFRRWLDPTGEQPQTSGVDTTRRPFPVSGSWERYAFSVGNLRFLMMSDRNDGGPPVGRGERGGYPAGAVTGETFDWWRRAVKDANDQNEIVFSAHHHMLRETTVASGPWEGFRKGPDGTWQSHYHGYFPNGGPKGASYLYFLDNKPDAQAFEHYLAEHPGAIGFWLGGHTHTNPDDRKGGRSHLETKWGVHFLNASALTRHHVAHSAVPMSRLLTLTDGSDQVRVQCYLHTSHFAPQGWYPKAERMVTLNRPFQAPKRT